MSVSHRAVLFMASVGIVFGLAPPDAHSQDSPARSERGLALEEITVTARKRDETLLSVPITISVVTASQIEAKDLKELRDVVDYSPGFYFGGPSGGLNDRSSHRLLMRGMQVNTDVQTRQGAMVFIDGAPILGAEIGGMESAERIETVKGPQSAYFGRATFGGAINFITRAPSMSAWNEKIAVEYGTHNTYKYGMQAEGPLVADKVGVRLSGSSFGNDGHYRSAAKGETLGSRKTDDAAFTLFAQPADNLRAKLRIHYWWEDDGPSAGVGYGRLNGQDVFNCNPGNGRAGTALTINGNNWVCGEPRFPTPSEISVDVTMDPTFRRVLGGDAAVCPTCGLLFGANWLSKFGLRRDAREYSLALDYTFANDVVLSSITASHRDKSGRIDDLDRRASASLGTNFDTKFMSERDLTDFSQEVRLTSAGNQKFRWLIGGNYSQIKQLSLGVTRNAQGVWSSGITGTALNKVKTIGVFGSLSYDVTEKVTVSVESRRQADKVTDGSQVFTQLNGAQAVPGITLSGTFKSFTPRVIVDYKPSNDITLYANYAQGTRPGEFNSQLISPLITPSVLACIGSAIFSGINIPEEDLTNYEAGIKGRFWGGRLTTTVAAYYAKWRNQHNRGQTNCPDANGVVRTFQSTGLGGASDLKGIELEAKALVTEHFSIEGTLADNETDILSRDCADCLLILGNRELAGLHKEFSRYPKISGTLSGTYQHEWNGGGNWFVRADYIHTGSQWATEANLAKTGVAHRVNLRFGFETDRGLRVELYGLNVLNDKTFTGFQRFDDQLFPGYHLLTAGLPDKPTFGLRVNVGIDRLLKH